VNGVQRTLQGVLVFLKQVLAHNKSHSVPVLLHHKPTTG